MNKYEFTGIEKVVELPEEVVTLRQIRAIRKFGDVEEGELGGWIENERNLSQKGNCWVSGDAAVWGKGGVRDNAKVRGSAHVSGRAWICENAEIYGEARIYGNAQVSGNAHVFGEAMVHDEAWIHGDAQIFGNSDIGGIANIDGILEISGKTISGKARDKKKFSVVNAAGDIIGMSPEGKFGCFRYDATAPFFEKQEHADAYLEFLEKIGVSVGKAEVICVGFAEEQEKNQMPDTDMVRQNRGKSR